MAQHKRVMILSVKAGAGHMRAAAAVEEVFRQRHPQVELRCLECLEHTSPAFRKSFTGVYERLVKHLPSVWGLIYQGMEKKAVTSKTKRLTAMLDRANSRGLLREVRAFDPDAIVCTHYFPAETLAPLRRSGKLRAPLSVVLTDYDIHVMWIQPGVDRYFVASDEMAFALKAKGADHAQVCVSGIPVMPVFAQAYPDKPTMRKRLGLRADVPAVLVAAGGFGLMGLDQVAIQLSDAAPGVQFVVIAGRNDKLLRQVEQVSAARPGRVKALGFVDNMHEWMAASDLAVTKSGGLTSSECLALGLPMVIINPIPGQEERNSDFLLESGAAVRANSPAHLVFKVVRLLDQRDRLARMSAAARQTARPAAAFEIVQRVMAT